MEFSSRTGLSPASAWPGIDQRNRAFADTQSSNFDFVTLQVLTAAAPLVICLGLATGIGVLFVFAVRWNRWN